MEVRPNLMNYLRSVRGNSFSVWIIALLTNPFLLHVFCMWNVIYDIAAPHRSRDNIIYVLWIQVVLFPIQDEVVPLDPQVYRNPSAEKNKCENIAVLINVNVVSK